MPNASSTPSPFRTNEAGTGFPRTEYDRELWDTIAGVVCYANDTTLKVPMPVAGLFEVNASGKLNTVGGTISVQLDGAPVLPAATAIANNETVVVVGVIPVQAGTHTLTLVISGAAITNPVIIVRRGRPNAQ